MLRAGKSPELREGCIMIRIDRVGRSGMLLAGLLAAAGLILAGRMGGNRPCALPDLVETECKTRQLDQDLKGALARVQGKQRVINDLLDGRLTFLEAAGHFRALDRLPPPFFWEHFRFAYPADSDEERHCLEVIAFLESHDDPCLGLAAVPRYQAELREHLKRGPIQLPDIQLDESP
jgi:hypothetical protein